MRRHENEYRTGLLFTHNNGDIGANPEGTLRNYDGGGDGNCKKKNALYLSVNVFSTKVLIGDTIFTSPTGDGTAILRGHPSHAKVQPPAGQRKYLHFSVILRP